MFSVIFDMDGTLLDTQRICIPAWEYAGSLQGITGAGDCIKFVCGMNKAGWSKYLLDTYPNLDVERFADEAREYILKNLVIEFKKGGRELLEFLKEKGIKIGLASGSSRISVEHHLNEVGVLGYFDAIVAGPEVENGKPAPDIFLLTAKKMGVDPNTCFVIEDSSNGVRAGYNAKMKCIGIPDVVPFDEGTKAMLYRECENLLEVIDIFKAL